MNQHLALRLFSFILLLAGFLNLSATHLIGGSLNYEYLGQNMDGTYRYRVFATTYTDCGPTSNIPDPEPLIPIGVFENDLADPENDLPFVFQFDLPLISTTPIEPDLPESCTVGADVCIVQGDYETFIDLDLNFDGYWLYYDRCCRNDATVNLQAEQGVGFTTYIPSPLIENNSPFFNAPPTPYICVGDTATFLNTAVDPDGDLLVFSFINPLAGHGDAVIPNPGNQIGYDDPQITWPIPEGQYNPGFSPEEPFGADGYAFINGATGLTQYSSALSGQFSIAVEIKEYRNGNLIGIVRRDLQLIVIACPPNPTPNLSALNDGQTEWEVAEGEELCFPVQFIDDNGDSLLLVSDGEIFDPVLVDPVGTINTPLEGDGQVTADFCWSTSCEQGREVPYFFSVTATDNGCPPKSTSTVYTVQVIPFTGSTFMNGESSPCAGSLVYYSTDSLSGADYVWDIEGGDLIEGQGTDSILVSWPSSGVGIVSVTMTNELGCVGDPFDLPISILPLPTIDAGSDVSICRGDSVTIGGAPTGPLGSFYIWGPDSSISDVNAANPQVFPEVDTEYIVNVISGDNCSRQDTVNVTVNFVEAEIIGPDSICDGTTTALQVLTDGNVFDWTPAGLLDDPSIQDPTAAPTMDTQFIVMVTDADNCTTSDTLSMTVLEQPSAEAGVDENICGFEYVLQAIPSIGLGSWNDIGGAAEFDDPGSPSAIVTVPNENFYELIWTESNAFCVSADTVRIGFIEQPIAEILHEDSICGDVLALDASPVTGNGAWTIPSGLSLDTDENDPNATATAATPGSYELIWTETNLLCSDADTLTTEFLSIPSVMMPAADSICGDEYSLIAVVSDITSGLWTASVPAVFGDESDPMTDVTSSEYGTIDITFIADNSGCTTEASTQITFVEIPEADAGPDEEFCGLELTTSAVPSVGVGSWDLGGLSLDDISSPTTTGLAPDYGTFLLTWTEDNLGCTDSDDVEYGFIQQPTPSAGLNDSICGSTYALAASTDLGTGLWTGPANISFEDQTDPNTVVTSSVFGTQTLTWTADNEGCTAAAAVDIAFLEIPNSDAGADISICGTETQLEAIPSIGAGLWTGPSGISIDAANASDSPVSTSLPGSYELFWTEDSNGCLDEDTVLVEFLEIPVATAVVDSEICIGDSINLQGSGGTSYDWSPSDGLNDASIADPMASPTEETEYSLVVIADNSCSDTTTVTIGVNPLPSVDAGDDIDYLCAGENAQLSATPGFDGYQWTPEFGLNDPSIANPVASPDLDAEIDYVVTVTDENGCQDSDTLRLVVNDDVPTDAGNDTTICPGEPVVLGGNPTSPPGTVYAWSPNIAMNDSTLANPTVSPIETTTYTVITQNGPCPGQDEVTVIVSEVTRPEVVVDTSASCDRVVFEFRAEQILGIQYEWFLNGSPVETGPDYDLALIYGSNEDVTLLTEGFDGCSSDTTANFSASAFGDYFTPQLPNVITPNDDGSNDRFDPELRGDISACGRLEIFNRWGQKVFESTGNNTTWDGRTPAGILVGQGTYFYVLELGGTRYQGSVQVLY